EDKPEGEDRKGNGHVGQNAPVSNNMKIAGGILEVRLDQPEHIDEPCSDHENAKPDHPALGTLEVTRQENAERNDPVANYIQCADRPPSAVDPVQVPRNFIRQVTGVDDEELREGQVDIEHHEGESQLAEIVLLGNAEHRLHRFIAREQDQREDAKRQNRITLRHQELEAINRGVPGDVQRLDEDDHEVRHRDDVEKQGDTRE